MTCITIPRWIALAGLLALSSVGRSGAEDRAGSPELAGAASAYLRSHATQSVGWHPWTTSSLIRARVLAQPILLVIGEVTSIGCERARHEIFGRDEVARIVGREFFPILVDRRERPDIDRLYRLAARILDEDRVGDPTVLLLTPETQPWGATTLPSPGAAASIFEGAAGTWRDRGPQARALAILTARKLMELSRRGRRSPSRESRMTPAGSGTSEPPPEPEDRVPGPGALEAALEHTRNAFRPHHGGFGREPGPLPVSLVRWLLHEARVREDDALLWMALHTLDGIGLGGVHDHLDGGFHRGAADDGWRIPVPGKDLETNARLAEVLVSAWELTRLDRFRDRARSTLGWTLDRMRLPGGGFACAEAGFGPSPGTAAGSLVWTQQELLAVLGRRDLGRLMASYGLVWAGAASSDPAEVPGVLVRRARPLAVPAPGRSAALPPAELERQAARCLDRLREARRSRPRPVVDGLVEASSVGAMIGVLARAGASFGDPSYLQAAREAATFVLESMTVDGQLRHAWNGHGAPAPPPPPAAVPPGAPESGEATAGAPRPPAGQPTAGATLMDHASVALGLLDLGEATGEDRWRGEAVRLARVLQATFEDPDGGFLLDPKTADVVLRLKNAEEHDLPSGNGLAAELLIRLAGDRPDDPFRESARRTLDAFHEILTDMELGVAAPASLELALSRYRERFVAPGPPAPDPGPVVAPTPVATAAAGSVTVAAFAGLIRPRPGARFPVVLELGVAPGWVVPVTGTSGGRWAALAVKPRSASRLQVVKVGLPPSRVAHPAFIDEPVMVVAGRSRIRLEVRVPDEARAGPAELELEVAFQAVHDLDQDPVSRSSIVIPVTIDPASTEEVPGTEPFRESPSAPPAAAPASPAAPSPAPPALNPYESLMRGR